MTAELARGGVGAVYRAQGPDGGEVALELLLAQRATAPTLAERARKLRSQAQAERSA